MRESEDFELQMHNKSDEDLLEIIKHKSDYVTDAMEAAEKELKRRSVSPDVIEQFKEKEQIVDLEREKLAAIPLSVGIGLIIAFLSVSLVTGFFAALISSQIYKGRGFLLKASQSWMWFLSGVLFWFVVFMILFSLN